MNILNYISLLLIFFTLRVIGDPFLLYFRFRPFLTHRATTINATTVKRIQQGSYSNLFILNKSSKQGQKAICFAAGSLVTVANRVFSQEYQDGFVDYYRLSETYISHFKWATQDMEALHRMKMNMTIYFYDEETKKRTQMPILDINMKCGLDFAEMMLKIRNKDPKHIMGIIIGHPLNHNHNLLYSSYLVFIPPNDPLKRDFIRPKDIRLALTVLISSNQDYTQIPQVVPKRAVGRKRDRDEDLQIDNDHSSNILDTNKRQDNSIGSSVMSGIPGPSSQSHTDLNNQDEEGINALIKNVYEMIYGKVL